MREEIIMNDEYPDKIYLYHETSNRNKLVRTFNCGSEDWNSECEYIKSVNQWIDFSDKWPKLNELILVTDGNEYVITHAVKHEKYIDEPFSVQYLLDVHFSATKWRTLESLK